MLLDAILAIPGIPGTACGMADEPRFATRGRRVLLTNLDTYLAIAKAAHTEAEAASRSNRRPKPDGSPGFILTLDLEQKSFKHSLIAIIFAGVYLEALLYIEGKERVANYHDRDSYEDKLRALEVNDPSVLDACKRFRHVRNSIVHEKAAQSWELGKLDAAQEEASHAIALVERVSKLLRAPA